MKTPSLSRFLLPACIAALAFTIASLSAADRTELAGIRSAEVDFDQVADTVSTRLEAEQVRRCLGALTELQRESIELAYYNGYTYPEVAQRLGAKLPTVKARMRDGLIRLRDCLGTTEGGVRHD